MMNAPLEVDGAQVAYNGDFDVDQEWIKEPSWTIAAGKATVLASGDPLEHHMHQPHYFSRFLSYTVELDVTNVNFTGDNGLIVIVHTNWSATQKITANGHHSVTIVAGTGAVYPGVGFMLYRWNQAGEGCQIDNVKCFPQYSELFVDQSWGDIANSYYAEHQVDATKLVMRYSNSADNINVKFLRTI